MKCTSSFWTNLLSVFAVILIFGNSAMAVNPMDAEADGSVISSYQDHDWDNPFVLNRLTTGDVPQTVSPTEYLGVAVPNTLSIGTNVALAGRCDLYHTSHFLQDKRKFIYRYLFPFHFFW